MAWLHSVPDVKHAKGGARPERVSRLKKMQANGLAHVELPPIPLESEYLWGHLLEAGVAMGDAPLAWGELSEYQRLVGLEFTPWEARTLRRLSREYLAERNAGSDPQRPAPWAAVSERQRDAVGRALSASLRAAAMAQRERKQ